MHMAEPTIGHYGKRSCEPHLVHPGNLVGKRDGGDLRGAPPQQRREAGPVPGSVDLGVTDDGECTGDEQAAQIAVTLFADAAEPVLAPTRVLLRNEPDPGREIAS